MAVAFLFAAGECRVRPHVAADLDAILDVYRQSEDFLSLGPVPTASMAMVRADIQHSVESGGTFCVIEGSDGRILGVLDFVPVSSDRTATLSLLMIALPHRNKGYGRAVMRGLEAWLVQHHGTTRIESGVQTNNPAAIRFWKRQGFLIGGTGRAMGDGTVAYAMDKILELSREGDNE